MKIVIYIYLYMFCQLENTLRTYFCVFRCGVLSPELFWGDIWFLRDFIKKPRKLSCRASHCNNRTLTSFSDQITFHRFSGSHRL